MVWFGKQESIFALKFKLITIEVTCCVAVLHIVSVWFGNQLIIQGAAGKYQVAQEKTQHDLDKAHQVKSELSMRSFL